MMTIKIEINGNALTTINVMRILKIDAESDNEAWLYRYSLNKLDWDNPLSGKGEVVHNMNEGSEKLAEIVLNNINEGLQKK